MTTLPRNAGRIRRGAALASLLAASAVPLGAQVDAWLQWTVAGTVPGEATWMTLYGFEQGAHVGVSTGATSVSAPQFRDTTLALEAGPWFPTFLSRLASGQMLESVRLHVVLPDTDGRGPVLLEIQWEGVVVRSAKIEAADADLPVASVTLNGTRQWLRTAVPLPATGHWELDFDFARAVTNLRLRTTAITPGDYPTPPPPSNDVDGDGLPDDWERLHGLDPANPNDADLDSDGDGLTNRQEFLLGLSPRDGQSRLLLVGYESDGGLRLDLRVGPGRRVELRRSATPPTNRDTDGEIVDVIEETFGGNDDALWVPFPDDPNAFWWVRVTAPGG